MDIDLVYTWVDGSDPDFHRAREQYIDPTTPGADLRLRRWRSHGELRYSLRSIARFAPWIRTIHIVTNGQRPAWLNLAHPRIRHVTHRQIYRWQEHLPTFNSTSIESHLHRIPGLSENFIYANDDMFLGAPVEPADFFSSLGFIQVHFGNELTERVLNHLRASDPTYSGMLNALQLLRREYPTGMFFWLDHQIKPYSISLYKLAEAKWPAAFQTTSANRFRCDSDVAMTYTLLHNLVIQARMGLVHQKSDVAVRLGRREDYQKVIDESPKFFCVNDEGGGPDGLESFLSALFPEPSEFENAP
ncbi:MAG TPA: Stealth CR1 domain-containing protein [Tepidisphaeraceae bacterium]|nr:Stealth CR1 domain-containing protein [Tepidisphaeraceae bacterium]